MADENPQVFIKVIPGGGTNSVSGLLAQIDYITKERDVMEFNAARQLEIVGKENPQLYHRLLDEEDFPIPRDDVHDMARRWVRETTVPPGTRDLTTHLVASFPFDSDREEAKNAALDWADEMFRSGNYGGDIYNYAYAVHRDKNHLHVHFIINRRGENGGWLKISNSSLGLHYDVMRQRMVPHALNHGIVLDATSREERGLIERPITSAEYRRRAEGRVKVFDNETGFVAAGPIPTPPPSRPGTPVADQPPTPAAGPAAATPPSSPGAAASGQETGSRKRKRTPETARQSGEASEDARRRADMREEHDLYGFSDTDSQSSSSPSRSPSPAPQAPSSGSDAAPDGRKRSVEAAELPDRDTVKRNRPTETAKRKRGEQPDDNPAEKRPRLSSGDETDASSSTVSPARDTTTVAASGNEIARPDQTPSAQPQAGPAPRTATPAPQDQPAGDGSSATDTRTETLTAEAGQADGEDSRHRRRRRQQLDAQKKSHAMQTRAKTEADKRETRSGKRYGPIKHKPRRNDDGRGT
ncbi:relaxase/mobilization nuclease-like protein [Phyllobacterium myrsinacearum]|uniref:relaxase/mobilization nuclease domain-containing protein n=1 Tax=Phyllobacterium myrsinacearum TaxID=28101 RepID=UPI001029CC77|nr:relaxase/mobilization nuclease domain-containing protein [Phyllobacterium myrsinacearum]RZS76849.1 relaxase/mobilization nuclease-like protein [Phyllobacterium myrsinacearum]